MQMRTMNSVRGLVFGLCAMGAVSAAGTSAAQWRVDVGYGQSGHSDHRSESVTFIVNGERFCIAGRSLACEIAEVLRCKGYDVCVEGDCVTVRYRGHAPRVSLAGCAYDLEVSRSRGCLVIRPYLIHPRSHDHGWQSGGSWNQGSWNHGSWNTRRSSQHRWPSRVRTGWTVRVGSSCR